ncbi:hypothetical protein GCM10011488_29260 [Steroidobacter agaridevorans]|nr:hypothetical protein GCM10011488_29260 [Steroidobacter agaridevorans]
MSQTQTIRSALISDLISPIHRDEKQTPSRVACRHRGFRMSAESPEVNRRILRRPEVEARCGFKRAHLYKLIDEGKFPRPVRIGVRAVGWDSVEVDQWIADQLQRRT